MKNIRDRLDNLEQRVHVDLPADEPLNWPALTDAERREYIGLIARVKRTAAGCDFSALGIDELRRLRALRAKLQVQDPSNFEAMAALNQLGREFEQNAEELAALIRKCLVGNGCYRLANLTSDELTRFFELVPAEAIGDAFAGLREVK